MAAAAQTSPSETLFEQQRGLKNQLGGDESKSKEGEVDFIMQQLASGRTIDFKGQFEKAARFASNSLTQEDI